MKVSVFRLEHIKTDKNNIGYGPYVSSTYPDSSTLCCAHNDCDHPNVYLDVVEGYQEWRDIYYCACADMKQLLEWFDEWLEKILEWDFEVVEYILDEDDVLYGDKQCAFDGSKVLEKKYVTDLVVSI